MNRKREIVKKNKIEFWDVRCIVKWYSIIDKIAFWDGKIR